MDDLIQNQEIPPTRVGLIGYPVEHSLSPKMHRAAFAALGLNWDYSLVAVPPDELQAVVERIRREGWRGFNVTIPHKQAIRALLNSESAEATLIGAVNTVVIENGRLRGYNTDWIGFLGALQATGFVTQDCRAVVLGAGGAARAVLLALTEKHAAITIVNRTLATAQVLADTFNELLLHEWGTLHDRPLHVVALDDSAALQTAIDEAELLVNCTSVGMSPHIHADPLPADILIPPHLTVYDLVYNPRDTQLLKRARAAGATGIDGLGMLVYQGAEAFRLWTDLNAPIDVMRQAIDISVISQSLANENRNNNLSTSNNSGIES